MRFHIVLRFIGFTLLLNALFMAISGIVSLIYADESFIPLFYSAFVTALFGVFPLLYVPNTTKITNKEGLSIVVISWLVSCLVGALPYILWGNEFSFTNAIFESVSGYTTTGSTILSNIEALPKGILFWRSATHFLGGVGIIIFVLSILPFIGIAEIVLYRNEVSSMASENFKYRTKNAIRIIAGVYFGLTVIEIVALLFAGMNLFDAVTHSFATIATGGFSPKNQSVAFYNSPSIEVIIMVFMILSGIHFGLLFTLFNGRGANFWKSTIVRYYLSAILIGILISSFSLYLSGYGNYWDSLRDAAFQLLSVGTSTGFATANTNSWPVITHILLILFSLQCACSGSTSGGIKVDRIVIALKAFKRQIKQLMHPNAVFPIKIDNIAVKESLVLKSILFIFSYVLILLLGTILVTISGVDILEAFTGSVATMGNVGPGLGSVGSTGNFGELPVFAKWVYSVLMLVGRLEIYALFIFFTPSQWTKSISY